MKKVLIRSFWDRTVHVLQRAVWAAALAGLILWTAANVSIHGTTLLQLCSDFLDPLGRLLGMDGVILMAFLLGLPANEIVIPIILMTYLSGQSLVSPDDTAMLGRILIENGWNWATAASFLLFSLMHWPCATSCLTIYKETGSLRWTLAGIMIPAATGVLICFLFRQGIQLFL